MSSNYLYRLKVGWTGKAGKQETMIPVYGFKVGTMGWNRGDIKDLDILKQEIDVANGRGSLTVCSHLGYCYRALENRKIERFQLFIKDVRFFDLSGERKVVATVESKGSMNGGNIIALTPGLVTMSVEGSPVEPSAVNLSFDPKLGLTWS